MSRPTPVLPAGPTQVDPEAPTLVCADGASPPAVPGLRPELNEAFGPYRITGVAGHGGMALVYRAEDGAGRQVALKVLQESPFLPAGMLARFRREAEATKRLAGHPHIVAVLDTGQVGRNHYIAMQFVPGGRTLVNLMNDGLLPATRALELALKIADALAFAHREGIIHRDIKPANVLITEAGEPLLADFGLARLESDVGANLTVSAMALGTPRYMAPEQATSLKAASHLSDMYSFGVVLYEMLTGRPPYEIDTEMGMEQLIRTIREHIPASPRRYRPGLSGSLEAVVMKLLEKDPRKRYVDMAAVAADLTACLNHSRVRASPFSLGYRADRFLLRHRRTVLLTMAASAAVATGVMWHKATLRAARHRQVVPQAEATSRALELQRLKETYSGADREEKPENWFGAAQTALLSPGGAATALQFLVAAQSKTSDAERLREIERELAWTRMAKGDTEEALALFGGLREQYARLREIRRVSRQDATLRDAKYAMSCLDEALATELAGRPTVAATLWDRAADELPQHSPQATLCAGARGQMAPVELAQWAAQQRPAQAALAYLLAALKASGAKDGQTWRQEARRLANPAVPWLYYYLTFGPGADAQPGVPSAKEARP